MRKWISILLLVVMMVLLLPSEVISNAASEDQINMTVHYHRFDEQYDGWNLWIWVKGKDGQSFAFNSDDAFGKKADFVLEGISSAEEIGFIVRKGEWEAKDVDADRFVSIDAKNAEGNIEIFLVQGVENVYYSESEIDLSPKFLKASFIDAGTIKISTSKPIEAGSLRNEFSLISESGATLKPTAVSSGSSSLSTNFVILLDGAVNINESYITNYLDYTPIPVEISGLYDSEAFETTYTSNKALGAVYTKEQTTFRVWAPTADLMVVNLYQTGDGDTFIESQPMSMDTNGVWEVTVDGDQNGVYYTYGVTRKDITKETYDPYATAAGVNGDRSMVLDFNSDLPDNWSEDDGPNVESQNDIIVYEMHIRDLSIDATSGIDQAGKYLGVIEPDTQTADGTKTGLSHLKELGITHVQILPMFDFNSIDETRLADNNFNWGYDPKNYSLPEGSYSSDPYHGEVRVEEMREMIQGLHDAGIGVIMDVVYNHTALSGDSNFSIIEPNYYYRMVDGKYSNASGTGNEIASERSMVKKMIIDSLVHWVSEYHIDGFRFDLMGVLDIETMNEIEKALREVNPDIVIYGEGWTGGSSPLPEGLRLVKANMSEATGIGAFSDDFRDGIKGHVFNATEGGFAGGFPNLEESVKFGIVGAVEHDGVNYKKVNYSKKPWAIYPWQSVNYVSAHDNLTLWDKLAVTNPDATEAERTAMDKLSNAIVLTSQGMPFLHAGVDFLRTKDGDENSYKSSDAINALDWDLKTMHKDVFEYYKGLIAVRKAYSAFSMATQEEIQANLHFFSSEASTNEFSSDASVLMPEMMIGYKIDKAANVDTNQDLYVFFNGALEAQSIEIPAGKYKVLINDQMAAPDGVEIIMGGSIQIPASSALVLEGQEGVIVSGTGSSDNDSQMIIIISVTALIMIGLVLFLYRRRQKVVK